MPGSGRRSVAHPRRCVHVSPSSGRGAATEPILDRIVRTKRAEVAALTADRDALIDEARRAPPARDFAGALASAGSVAVIAEVKRRSPGAGAIRPDLDPVRQALGYESGGASAVSVLTDGQYFSGSLDDLRHTRDAVALPVLRKDFVLDPVQLWQARAAGADAVLLIVRILDDQRLSSLHALAGELGMAALVEVHDAGELERALAAEARIVGINNRDLSTFQTSLDVTLALLDRVPDDVQLVSESGIAGPDDVDRLGAAGVDAVLVGEWLVRQPDPRTAAAALSGRFRAARHR